MAAVASGASIPSGIVGAHAGGHLSAVRDAPADRSRRLRLYVRPMRCAMGVRQVRQLRRAVPHAARDEVLVRILDDGPAFPVGEADKLFELFTRTREIRRGIVEIGQDSAAPDFGRPHAQLGKKAD